MAMKQIHIEKTLIKKYNEYTNKSKRKKEKYIKEYFESQWKKVKFMFKGRYNNNNEKVKKRENIVKKSIR